MSSIKDKDIESEDELDIKNRISAVVDTILGLERSIEIMEGKLREARRKRRGC
jgi:hypothetical protein